MLPDLSEGGAVEYLVRLIEAPEEARLWRMRFGPAPRRILVLDSMNNHPFQNGDDVHL